MRLLHLLELLRLPLSELVDVFRAQAALVGARRRVRAGPLGELVSVTEPEAGCRHGAALPPLVVRMERAVARASRAGLFRPSCLERSLALTQLIRGRVHEDGLQIAVRWSDGEFRAYAWVEPDAR